MQIIMKLAIEYMKYREWSSVALIMNQMRKDRRSGGHPALHMIQS